MWWILGIVAVIVVGSALAWWSSGRAAGTRRMRPEEAIWRTQGEVVTDRASHQTGPGPIG